MFQTTNQLGCREIRKASLPTRLLTAAGGAVGEEIAVGPSESLCVAMVDLPHCCQCPDVQSQPTPT
jgi:hypothetical protein